MKTAARVRVLIVDDHQMFADGLAAALDREPDIDVVGTASLVSESVEKASAVRPNVVVLDQLLPDGDGIEAAELIKHEVPGASVVGVAARAVENGCSGFVTKDKSIDEVVAAIRAAAAGEAVIAPAMLARLFERYRRTPDAAGEALSARELDVLRLLGEGFDNQTVAERLAVKLTTVRNHVQSIIEKLGVHSKLEAVIAAMREGLIPPPRHE
ncbi:MAG: response regulator transcription factor [Actinobacteria bacterium]|nr:MAG: response regulator transcription factor [Actinomycetota bacterium]